MSLRARLLLLLGAVWLVFGGAVTLWAFQHASAELDAALDSRLAASAAMVARLMTQWPRAPREDAVEMAAAVERKSGGWGKSIGYSVRRGEERSVRKERRQ